MSDDFEGTFEDGEEDSLMIDFGNIKEASFDPVPKDLYNVVVEKCDFQISKSSKKPMWSMMYNITDGEYEGKKLFQYISFSEKALEMSKKFIRALNPEWAENAFNPKALANSGEVCGKTLRLRVIIEAGQDGEPRNAVKGVVIDEDGDGEGDFAL